MPTQREVADREIEMFIHRLVYRGKITYDDAIACLESHQCGDMRQAWLEDQKSRNKKPEAAK